MKIACASDAHGARRMVQALVAALPPIDAFCFLGDVESDGRYLEALLRERQPGAAFHAVAGNNDFHSDLPASLELQWGGLRAFVTHGHLFRVKLTTTLLCDHARARACSLALFGHTHAPLHAVYGGVLLVNPGALRGGQWALIDAASGDVSLRVLGK